VHDALKHLVRSRTSQRHCATDFDAKDRGVFIFGIAFTQSADFQLIQSVAQVCHGADAFRGLAVRHKTPDRARPKRRQMFQARYTSGAGAPRHWAG